MKRINQKEFVKECVAEAEGTDFLKEAVVLRAKAAHRAAREFNLFCEDCGRPKIHWRSDLVFVDEFRGKPKGMFDANEIEEAREGIETAHGRHTHTAYEENLNGVESYLVVKSEANAEVRK